MVRVNNKKDIHITPARTAIFTTILYSDIFSFPLKEDELWKFLISDKKINRSVFNESLKIAQGEISYEDGFYCLKNREEIIRKRKTHLSEVEKKMRQAQSVASKLAYIPSILFIGVSGGLAAGNVSKEDDIDLIIITRKNTLFVSRFFILMMLQLLGVRRFRNQKDAADTICVNLLFDELVLDWFTDKQDIYTAREIAQIIPLVEREDSYRQFLLSNKWILKFLPNFVYQKRQNNKKNNMRMNSIYKIISNSFFETIFRSLQIQWMSRHKTKEIINKHFLAFHPNDYRTKALDQLRLKMRQLGLLTKI